MTGGVVLAAGFSTRMGCQKPLLRLNGFPMLAMSAQSLKNAGASVCVVTGQSSESCEAALSGMEISFVRNESPDPEDMFASVRLGVERLRECDEIFILPADTPLVSPGTLLKLKLSGAPVVYPVCGGKKGHPPLIRRECFDGILSHKGGGGLKAALAPFYSEKLETGDEGALMDADTPEDFEKVAARARKLRGLSRSECERLWDEASLLPNIRRHCAAVGELSAEMAEALIKKGYCLDVELCRSAGLLHDILRLEKRHYIKGAQLLRERGFEAIAGVVRAHNDFEENPAEDFDEKTIVCLADKLLKEDERVTVERRYAPARAAFDADTDLGRRIRRDELKCRSLAEKYHIITGTNLERKV